MSGLLDGKVVLVTGAAGGIGRATSLLAAKEGARVAATDVSEEGVAATADLVRAAGGEAIALPADLTVGTSVDAMVAAVVDHYGSLDGAFNNAGVSGGQIGQGGRSVAEWDEEAFDRAVAVNLKGVWLCMRAELKQMTTQGGGAIVNTASLAGLTGFKTTAGYAAAKHGVVGLTKTAAIEYAPTIRINAVCPGYTDTDLMKDAKRRSGSTIMARIPFGALAQPDDIAEMACWLLSDRAGYATGGSFVVDGGYMAG
ncbi:MULTISPECIES: SDR family NAD(P)-dependent oxidoreductase [unclassified Rhodococcus (in: high G+C Gram-positive bacteria)]|uniref:SDR family NAD(P)-dependent oxidoreductase n=1 Tax=unclassified Rhodococcus (in: high G+C Gram-positive bacteria) TaxID=192944 RepID=UPI00163B1138|nr:MULTISPECIES: SDR family oxidoreductase [unclassified Rhodococcus (in: high G+C Gram-positive bacteria)]MBC2640882.1 SDR family oxidoreductase [Rhodococcus sp. 3A]MBC2894374.1 SDR family oxidoreductase [Rhodococcus sp. 4CII]